jgi:hypothetical protein
MQAQKSSQKSTRPRGAKDVVSFPGAIGRNNACVRADAQQIAEGGGATAARRGVYRSGWLASVPMPTAAGPRRSSNPPVARDPSTWFVVLRVAAPNSRPKWSGYLFCNSTATCRFLSIIRSSWRGRIKDAGRRGQGEIFPQHDISDSTRRTARPRKIVLLQRRKLRALMAVMHPRGKSRSVVISA